MCLSVCQPVGPSVRLSLCAKISRAQPRKQSQSVSCRKNRPRIDTHTHTPAYIRVSCPCKSAADQQTAAKISRQDQLRKTRENARNQRRTDRNTRKWRNKPRNGNPPPRSAADRQTETVLDLSFYIYIYRLLLLQCHTQCTSLTGVTGNPVTPVGSVLWSRCLSTKFLDSMT